MNHESNETIRREIARRLNRSGLPSVRINVVRDEYGDEDVGAFSISNDHALVKLYLPRDLVLASPEDTGARRRLDESLCAVVRLMRDSMRRA